MKPTKQEKSELQQQRSNVFRDRKRRVFYINKKTGQGYRLNHDEERFIYLYDAKILFIMFPIALSFSFLKTNNLISFVVALFLYIGIELWYRLKVEPTLTPANIPEDVQKIHDSELVMKEKQKDNFLKASLSFLVIIIVTTSIKELHSVNMLGTKDLIVSVLSILIALSLAIQEVISYLKLKKQLKNK